MYQAISPLFVIVFKVIRILFRSKNDLIIENLALRQQLAACRTKKIKPKLSDMDRSFWVALREVWSNWTDTLIIVKPETVVDWQRRRFKKYWWEKSSRNRRPGRRRIDQEIRDLIKQMVRENNWGAPRIYSELLMLGYKNVKERTVSRYLRIFRSKHPDKQKQQSWRTFLKNHRDTISAMDFFVVPTVTFRLLYVFFVIDHAKRKIVHLNITEHPTTEWVIHQLREAFPFGSFPKYLIFDRDSIFSIQVKEFIKSMGTEPKVISYRSPWQNGVAERWILSVRTELLNHVIIFSEDHLRRLLKKYVTYYNHDRCHLTLDRNTPLGRKVQSKPPESSNLISIPRVGGLHHKYVWRKAA
ncbi:MAG: integrase core domain-containing protein [Desulfobacterales bacterium]